MDEVETFLATVAPPGRAADARRLDAIFRQVTGYPPQLWHGSIIGYGRYHYKYASGREGDYLATGFSPRKARMVVYIMPGYADFGEILGRLGSYRKGKSCLYLPRLDKVDEGALRELIAAGLADLESRWAVHPA